jgi:hypothetical protein
LGAKLVWSPLSNLMLYGLTTNVYQALAARVLVSLGTDCCATPRFFVGTGQIQRRIISWELARGVRGKLTREEL